MKRKHTAQANKICADCVLENGYSFATCKNAMILQLHLQWSFYLLLLFFSSSFLFFLLGCSVFLSLGRDYISVQYFCAIIKAQCAVSHRCDFTITSKTPAITMRFDFNYFDQFNGIVEIKMRPKYTTDDVSNKIQMQRKSIKYNKQSKKKKMKIKIRKCRARTESGESLRIIAFSIIHTF